jgi:hypothetical protein
VVLSIPFISIADERGDPLSSYKQRPNDVHGKRGFATAVDVCSLANARLAI